MLLKKPCLLPFVFRENLELCIKDTRNDVFSRHERPKSHKFDESGDRFLIVKGLFEKAGKQAELLRKSTNAVMTIAVLVYLVMSVLAIVNEAWIMVLFCTCLLLGVGVIYLFILTVLTHLEIIRSGAKQ